MTNFDPKMRTNIRKSIVSLCRIISDRINSKPQFHFNEYFLRKELVACILGSQVRYEMASLTLDRIEAAGLLEDNWWIDVEDDFFETGIYLELSKGYRFPKIKTKQLVGARDYLSKSPLTLIFKKPTPPQIMRNLLSKNISGFGPKQASMFLRNIGWSYDLAIIDIHVLRFMELEAIITSEDAKISNLRAYERLEKKAIGFANDLGYPVGYLDLAIWATMKAASELRI